MIGGNPHGRDGLTNALRDYDDGGTDERECIVDCLTELLHFADQYAVSFDSALEMARRHFTAEQVTS